MIGIDAEANKDQESMDASKIASDMLDAPSPCRPRKGSTTRRKSVLLGPLDPLEDSDSSDEEKNKKNRSRRNSTRRNSNYGDNGDEESNKKNRSRRSSTRRKSNCGDNRDADEPSGMSLLNHRPKSSAANSRRSSAVNSRRGNLKK